MVPPDHDLDGSVLVERLRNIGQRLTRAGNRRMLESGLSYSRARLLFKLARDGPSRAVDLAQFFQQAPRTVTEALDGLERDGLVTRAGDSADRRVKHIAITDAGRSALDRAIDVAATFGNEVAAALGRSDTATLVALIERIDRHLLGSDDDAAMPGGT